MPRFGLLFSWLVVGALHARELPLAAGIPASEKLESMRSSMGLDDRSSFKMNSVQMDDLGQIHARFPQFFQGVRVWGGDVITHDDGRNHQIQATLAHKVLPDLNVIPVLEAKEALAIAHRDLAPQGPYAYEPECELLVYPVISRKIRPGRSSMQQLNAMDMTCEVVGARLVYHIHTVLENRIDPLAHTDFLIDAHSGEVVKKWSSLMTNGAEGRGITQYNGQVALSTHRNGDIYELKDPERNFNYVTDMGRGVDGKGALYTDKDNVWGNGRQYDTALATTSDNGQTAAADAAFGQQATWDMFLHVFGQRGIVDEDTTTYVRVHYGKSNADAFYEHSCKCVTLGDAGRGYKDSYSIQSVAHELGHAFCHGSAKLYYMGESGALCESNSDIMAACVYFYTTQKGAKGSELPSAAAQNDKCWDLYSQEGKPLRYMSKPSKNGKSVDAWDKTLEDVDDIHCSAGPNNRMFFFLSTGASGDKNSEYYSSYAPKGFSGIGPHKAARLWHRTMKYYLTSDSRYREARDGCLISAEDLYGKDSAEYIAVENAFGAINVGAIHQ